MSSVPFHPLANLFPLIEGEAFAELVADIAANGLSEPIVLHQAQILDGRNRYRACRLAGVAPRFIIFGLAQASEGIIAAALAGRALREDEMRRAPVDLGALEPDFTVAGVPGADALAFVVSRNLHRRHLDESQRAMVAARIARLQQGRRPQAADADKAANLPDLTQAEAAGRLNVSERSVRSARSVLDAGAPELVAAVEHGAVAVSAAADLAVLPLGEQKRLIETADPRAIGAVIKRLRDEKTAAKKTARVDREAALARRQQALPDRKYGVIYADPEWRWEPRSRETGMDRAADNHYPTSDTNDIVLRPVGAIAAADCALFLWATAPMLKAALRVLEGWGFEYRTHLIWHKLRPGAGRGPGYWVTGEHELLLIGTRGAPPCPAPGTQWRSLVAAPIGAHSEKPAIFYELIEEYFPNLPKIELNARAARPGWDRWGYEAPAQEGGEAAE